MNRIAERRNALGLSRQQCADALDVNYTTFWRWENDEMVPHPRAMQRLADFFQITPAELFPSWFSTASLNDHEAAEVPHA